MIIAIIGRILAELETTDKGFGSAPTTGQGRGQICVRSDPTVICLYFLDLRSVFFEHFFHIQSWSLCIFSETEEYMEHQLFYPRKKTFSHNSLLLETHNILTFSEWQKKNISNYKGLGIGRLLLLITKYSLFSKQFI